MNSTVCVFDRQGKPVRSKKVSISISGVLSGGMADGITDSSGCANIEHSSKGTAKIFINGNNVGTFVVPERTTVTI